MVSPVRALSGNLREVFDAALSLGWPALAERSDRWQLWFTPSQLGYRSAGLEEVVAAGERAQPGRADGLPAALVRLGAVEGGTDQGAAGDVAPLLAIRAARRARHKGTCRATMTRCSTGRCDRRAGVPMASMPPGDRLQHLDGCTPGVLVGSRRAHLQLCPWALASGRKRTSNGRAAGSVVRSQRGFSHELSLLLSEPP